MQEMSGRQKRKTILGPLLSKQVIANCKEPPRTSDKPRQCGPDSEPQDPAIPVSPSQLFTYTCVSITSSCFFTDAKSLL